MFITMLKNQRVTFVSDYGQATEYSPFFRQARDGKPFYTVWNSETNQVVAAGMDKIEAEACVMFKANEYIFRKMQANK